MKKTVIVTLASLALFTAASAMAEAAPFKGISTPIAEHAAQPAKTGQYFSTLQPQKAAATKTLGVKSLTDSVRYATDIVILNMTSSTFEVMVDHPPALDDILPPGGFDRISCYNGYGLTDLHIYFHGEKIFDELVRNHAVIAIYPDGIDVDNVSI